MPERLEAAVVGAGPYGLSIAAHLRARARTFGEPMETWRTRMPQDMLLRSDWSETSFSAPGDAGAIDTWSKATGEPRREPIPLQAFLRYARWFRESFVHELEPSPVASVERAPNGFRVTTASGDEVDVDKVIVAVGAVPFAYAPPPFDRMIGDGVRHATDLQDYEVYRSKRVLVVGGGQGGLESAALAARAGADVELVVRSRLHWFTSREPHAPRGRLHQRLYRLAYPVVGYGPPPLNRLVLHPDLLARLPERVRRRLTERVLRAGGSPWLRPALAGVQVTEGTAVQRVERTNAHLTVDLTDGSQRSADVVIVAAGFRFDVSRLTFLAEDVRAGIRMEGGWPVLDRYFRSSDPNLVFAGFAAAQRFGPIVRFIPGTRFAAPRVAELFGRR
jgi:cation diffusion facilitator CzcD-associated flavoprotein CzcO